MLSGVSSSTISLKFKKRAGTTDRGKDYEHLYIANLILKLVREDTVENFYLSSNDDKFGSFDDVVLELKYVDKDESQRYAIQLKQSKNKILRSKDLQAPKGNFSIAEYLKDYNENLKTVHNSTNLVLFTNCNTQISDKFLVRFENEEFAVITRNVPQNDLLSSYAQRSCYMFETENKHNDFFQTFFLYAGQADVFQMEKETFKMFSNTFCGDKSAFQEFLLFITEWSKQEGNKYKLDKKWMKDIIALSLLSPFVKPLTFMKSVPVNSNGKQFQNAVSKFHITALDNDDYIRIKNLWTDIVDEVEIVQLNQVRKTYQLTIDHIGSREHLRQENKEISKLWWLLGKCPLVVEESLLTYQAMALCPERSFIVLGLEETRNTCQNAATFNNNVFKTLSDLRKEKDIFDNVLHNFMYSLEGQKEACLKNLLKWNQELESMITASKLTQMIDGPLLIGRVKEVLPPCHVVRTISKILIDLQFLNEVTSSVIIISEVEDLTAFTKLHLNTKQKQHSDEHTALHICVQFGSNVVHLYKDKFSEEDFYTLHKKDFAKGKCHHFKYIGDQSLEWIRSIGGVEELQKFRLHSGYNTNSIHESELFLYNDGNINIICANPGMGKTTLMKNLKISSNSSTWTILICARNHALHFRKKGDVVNEFMNYIFDENCHLYDPLDREVFKTLLEKDKVQLIWDGLDEVSDQSLEVILNLIKTLFNKRLKQWITSRTNLRSFLEERLHILSREVKLFNETEQRLFVKQRLDLAEDHLNNVFQKIKMNLQLFSNNDILGIPLQIYMLTELFKQNLNKYSDLLTSSFTILDLYENFVFEKFEIYFDEKRQNNRNIEEVYQSCEEERKDKINFYKKLAFYLYLESKYRVILKKNFECFNTFTNFLERIKQERDPVGLISKVTIENIPEFSHNSYGEYFAALYLFENNPEKAKEEKFVVNKQFNNIRFFLDLMLSRGSKAHIAVLCRNCLILDQSTEADLDGKDQIGRSVLEVSCAWNEKRSCVQTTHNYRDGKLCIEASNPNKKDRKLRYTKISKQSAFDTLQCNIKKILLLLPFLIPLLNTSEFSNNQLFATMLYYAIEYDYVVIFKYIKNVQYLKDTYENFDPESLLTIAVRCKSLKCLQEFVLNIQYRNRVRQELKIPLMVCTFETDEFFSLLIKQGIDLNTFVCFACQYGNVEHLLYLQSKGVNFDIENTDSRTPMHHALDNNKKSDYEIIKFLTEIGMDVNATDVNGFMPVYYALRKIKCHFGELKPKDLNCVRLLAKHGAAYSIPQLEYILPFYHPLPDCEILNLLLDEVVRDPSNQNVVSSACEDYNSGLKSLHFLIYKGFKLDVPDTNGSLPIHYACKMADVNTVAFLLQNFETITTPDAKGRISIHLACKNVEYSVEIVTMLCDMGVNLDVRDIDGRLPIHHACLNEDLDLLNLFIDKGAKVNVPDGYNQFPLHYVTQNEFSLKLVKLLIHTDATVILGDINGDLPIHRALLRDDPDYKTIKLLLPNSKNINVANLDGEMPIHHACNRQSMSLQIVKFFLANGAEINAMTANGYMPIHSACAMTEDFNFIKFLIANGAEVNTPDSNDQMPIHHACRNMSRAFDIVKFLMTVGAKPDVPDSDGLMPVHHACENACDRTVKLLMRGYRKGNVVDNGQNLIHHACKNRQCGIEIVDLLINEGENTNTADKCNRVPMHYACENDRHGFEIVQLLTYHGGDVNSTDAKGLTPVHIACMNTCGFDIVRLLLEKEVNFEVADVEGRHPIHYACENNRCGYAIVKLLIHKGTRIDIPDVKGRLPIHYACMKGNFKIVQVLLNHDSETLNVKDVHGRMSIHYACGNFEFGTNMLRPLVDKGAKVDIPDVNNKLPIHFACESGSLETVKFLIDNDVNLHLTDDERRLPIHYSSGNIQHVRRKNISSGFQITNMLIRKGQNIHVTDKNQKMPIHYACETGGHITVKLLLDHGAKVDVPDIDGRLPIHYAAQNNSYANFKIVKYLLDHGAELNVPDSIGRTPVHYACQLDYDLALKFLMFKGAKLDIPDVNGVTPIHCACVSGYRKYVKILIDKGAKEDVPDAHGRMALHYACRNKEHGFPIVKLLLERGAKVDVVDDDGLKPVDYAQRAKNFKVERLLLSRCD